MQQLKLQLYYRNTIIIPLHMSNWLALKQMPNLFINSPIHPHLSISLMS
jgi:hypothetical protein